MTAQPAIIAMRRVAPLLTSNLAQEQYDELARIWNDVDQPISEEEVRIFLSMLPADGDDAFGFNWSLLHAIEKSPCWPLWDALNDQNEWGRRLRQRLANAGEFPPK